MSKKYPYKIIMNKYLFVVMLLLLQPVIPSLTSTNCSKSTSYQTNDFFIITLSQKKIVEQSNTLKLWNILLFQKNINNTKYLLQENIVKANEITNLSKATTEGFVAKLVVRSLARSKKEKQKTFSLSDKAIYNLAKKKYKLFKYSKNKINKNVSGMNLLSIAKVVENNNAKNN